MKYYLSAIAIVFMSSLYAQYSPPAGVVGSTAIKKDSSIIVGWAKRVVSFNPGPEDISEVGSPIASFGDPSLALGEAEGNSTDIVSLGDRGEIVLEFHYPIMNGSGPDFAVFENSFSDDFLEFAHVEVSTDGTHFVRIPSYCEIQSTVQTGSFGSTNTEKVHNLAGKFRQGHGTPFDLEDIVDSTGINLDSINYVKIIDVVGSIDPTFGTYDSEGNIINDPFTTAFESGGFDLDAVGVIHANGSYVVGLEDLSQDVMVYPNPTTNLVHIKTKAPMDKISLVSLDGRFITDTEEMMIDFSSLNVDPGIYLIMLENSEGKVSIKRISYNPKN